MACTVDSCCSRSTACLNLTFVHGQAGQLFNSLLTYEKRALCRKMQVSCLRPVPQCAAEAVVHVNRKIRPYALQAGTLLYLK